MNDRPTAPDDRVADYRSGALSADERRRFEKDVLERDDLAEELYADLALENRMEAAGAGGATKVVPISRMRRITTWAVPLAAAAALLIVFAQRAERGDTQEAGLRGSADTPELRLTEPETLTLGSPLQWTAVEGAASYRVEVSHENGEILWRHTARGTSAIVQGDSLVAGPAFCSILALDENGFALGTSSPRRVLIRAAAAE